MISLDIKDRKIMFQLSKNCRLPTTKLAKKVGLSQQVVDYRINRLIHNGIIINFITEINLSKLGYNRTIMYIQLKGVDEKKEKEIVKYFINHPFLTWVATCTGKWSIIFDIIAKDIKHINEIVEKIKEKYGEFLGEYKIVSQIDYKYFNSKYYGFKEAEITQKSSMKKYNIDEIDLRLLKLISNNARLDYVQLTNNINLTANGIKNRLKNLIQSNIIESFTIIPNKILLGYEQYNIQFTFENINKEKEKLLMNYIKDHPNINFYYKPIGHWDLEIGIFVKNPSELRKIILDMRNKFSDIIKIYDTVLFYEEPKSNFIPEGIFKE